ncbi:MAG: helix-turn-helix domain-containing protein [Xanthobacteraceae bacterium]|nr:helix-turn-helix domain-containing protein [Xanthobacteraceae bacterium]
MDPFGVLFGRLVREKRGIEGRSQDGLSEKAGLTKARISDIETGKIANPQARTVDSLCVALNITREERAACHTAPASGLPARLLEKLARHFGADMPEATEEEFEAFLMAKAEEFREMQERLEKLAQTEGRISELVRAANAALGEGDFEPADDLLREAEAVQLQSSTIVALKKQAELRIERGKAALVNGEVAAAAGHFERSSRYFSGVAVELEGKTGTNALCCCATTDTATKAPKRFTRREALCSRTSASGSRTRAQRSGARRRTRSAA